MSYKCKNCGATAFCRNTKPYCRQCLCNASFKEGKDGVLRPIFTTKRNEFLGIVTPHPDNKKTEPVNQNCVVCNKPWSSKDVRTTSFVAENGELLTYFWRSHKTCHNSLSAKGLHELESSFVDNL